MVEIHQDKLSHNKEKDSKAVNWKLMGSKNLNKDVDFIEFKQMASTPLDERSYEQV